MFFTHLSTPWMCSFFTQSWDRKTRWYYRDVMSSISLQCIGSLLLSHHSCNTFSNTCNLLDSFSAKQHPPSLFPFSRNSPRSNSLKITYFDVQSLLLKNGQAESTSWCQKPEILCVFITWLSTTICDNEVSLQGFQASWQFREWELAPSMEMQILVIIIDFI